MLSKQTKKKRPLPRFSGKKLLKRAIITALLRLKFISPKKEIAENIGLASEEFHPVWCAYVFQNTKINKRLSEIAEEVEEKKKRKRRRIHLLKKYLKQTPPLDPRFFKPWRYEILFSTAKQTWLKNKYRLFKDLSLKDRTDFFQTQIGQMMLSSFFSFPLIPKYGTEEQKSLRRHFLSICGDQNVRHYQSRFLVSF